jgi:hypothetical protein
MKHTATYDVVTYWYSDMNQKEDLSSNWETMDSLVITVPSRSHMILIQKGIEIRS